MRAVKKLSGTSVDTQIDTEFWIANEEATYDMEVSDQAGVCVIAAGITVTPAAGDYAPKPHITVPWPHNLEVGDTLHLSAEWSEYDGDWDDLTFAWDLNDDDVYDIGPTSVSEVTHVFTQPGEYSVRLRVSDDAAGVYAVSLPVLIVVSEAGSANALLKDDFEDENFDQWTDGGTTDWDFDSNEYHSSSPSACAGPDDNDLVSDNLDASGADSITLDFWRRVDDVDDSDDVYLQLYNGTSYVNRYEIGNAAEDTWTRYQETINNSGGDAQYFIANFRIKFEASSLDTGRRDGDEHLWIDDVVITAGSETDPPTPDPATFSSAPAAASDTSVEMTATVGSDATPPILYQFEEVTGHMGSTLGDWRSSNDYVDEGLEPNTQYGYRVRMRDSYGNMTDWSGAFYVTVP